MAADDDLQAPTSLLDALTRKPAEEPPPLPSAVHSHKRPRLRRKRVSKTQTLGQAGHVADHQMTGLAIRALWLRIRALEVLLIVLGIVVILMITGFIH